MPLISTMHLAFFFFSLKSRAHQNREVEEERGKRMVGERVKGRASQKHTSKRTNTHRHKHIHRQTRAHTDTDTDKRAHTQTQIQTNAQTLLVSHLSFIGRTRTATRTAPASLMVNEGLLKNKRSTPTQQEQEREARWKEEREGVE